MKENFPACLKLILSSEGGFVDHALDRGGATNQGITLATLRQYRKDYDYGDLDGDGDVDVDDVFLLETPEEAAPIYKRLFWDRMRLDELPGGVDYLLFDFGVNSGPKNAARILQKALSRMGYNLDLDGILGSKTIEAAKNADPDQLIRNMLLERDIFYRKIVACDISQDIFFKGWMNRLARVTTEVRHFIKEAAA